MDKFLGKLESYIFDALGLILPGFVLICIVYIPVLFIDYTQPNVKTAYCLMLLEKVSDLYTKNPLTLAYWTIIISIASYILGHLVKVMSKYQYELCENLFDKFLGSIIALIATYRWIKNINTWIYKKRNVNFRSLVSFVVKLIIKIFTFKSPDYYKDASELMKDATEKFNAIYQTHFPIDAESYPSYKIATIALNQDGIRSLTGLFLAKYNLYRSLAFLFFANFAYLIYINHILLHFHLFNLLMWINLILWFSFHEKYKRYWTLCGHETRVNFYYYMLKTNKKVVG